MLYFYQYSFVCIIQELILCEHINIAIKQSIPIRYTFNKILLGLFYFIYRIVLLAYTSVHHMYSYFPRRSEVVIGSPGIGIINCEPLCECVCLELNPGPLKINMCS